MLVSCQLSIRNYVLPILYAIFIAYHSPLGEGVLAIAQLRHLEARLRVHLYHFLEEAAVCDA